MGQALDTVRWHYEAFRRQDRDAVLALYDADVEADLSRSGIPDAGVYHGHDGLRAGWAKWRGVWERYDFELEELIEVGDRVLALTRVQARSKGQGMEAEVRGADVLTVRNGLIVHFVNFMDRDAALREAGLS